MLWGTADGERRAIWRGPAVYPGRPFSVFVLLTAITPGMPGLDSDPGGSPVDDVSVDHRHGAGEPL